jgi:hypothetical protein
VGVSDRQVVQWKSEEDCTAAAAVGARLVGCSRQLLLSMPNAAFPSFCSNDSQGTNAFFSQSFQTFYVSHPYYEVRVNEVIQPFRAFPPKGREEAEAILCISAFPPKKWTDGRARFN